MAGRAEPGAAPIKRYKAWDEDLFRVAAATGDVAAVSGLLRCSGSSAEAASEALTIAAANGHASVVHTLLGLQGGWKVDEHARGDEAFLAACAGGHVHIVRIFLQLQPPRQSLDATALMNGLEHATWKDHGEVLSECLEWGPGARLLTRHGMCVLLDLAARHGSLAVAQRLLEIRGRLGVRDKETVRRAFTFACAHGCVPMVQMLLDVQGPARVNLADPHLAALPKAARYGHMGVVKALLDAPAARGLPVDSFMDHFAAHPPREAQQNFLRLFLTHPRCAGVDWQAYPQPPPRALAAYGQFITGAALSGVRAAALWGGTAARHARRSMLLLRRAVQGGE